MCNMQLPSLRIWPVLFGCLLIQTKAYPLQGWPVYPQAVREYQGDDYFYSPKVQYYYENPVVNMPEVYGQVPYPYMYDAYGHYANEAPKRQEERFSALPIGQETWFESEASPRWRSNDVDDVSAAFLDNLILTQMAQDAQRRRENVRAAFPDVADYDETDAEDEDVRELKALAGKPLYHVPKTVPEIEEDDDYQNDDGFINWNGNKRSVTTTAPVTSAPKEGQQEIMVPRPSQDSHKHHSDQNKRTSFFYGKLANLLEKEKEARNTDTADLTKSRRINKRFVAGDSDLVLELRGLKHRIPT